MRTTAAWSSTDSQTRALPQVEPPLLDVVESIPDVIENGAVTVEQVLGDDRLRCHPPQFIELCEWFAQILEVGAELVPAGSSRTRRVVADLTHRAQRPRHRTGQPLRAEHDERCGENDQEFAPPDAC